MLRDTIVLVSILAATAAAVAFAKGCDETPEAYLLRIAAQLRDSDDRWFGHAQIGALEREKAALGANDERRRIAIDVELYGHQLRLGDVDAGLASIERALAAAREDPGARDLSFFYSRRGLAWMRLAEKNNCVARHRASCCIWPLAGDGLHSDAAPAEHALDDFLAYLRVHPDDAGHRWLAHVAASACQRPEKVPLELRWPETPAAAQPQFIDRGPDLGIDVFDLCGGAAVVDVDGDGLLDLVSTTWDPSGPMKLFHNVGDGTFTNMAEASGLAHQYGGLNMTVADYDNDGDADLLVLRGAWLMDRGQIRRSLLQNDGHGHFTDVTKAVGLAEPARPTQNAVWADFDNDGDLDLFVGNESRRETKNPPGGEFPCQLFRNDGGVFTDIAAAAGVTNDRFTKGSCAGDFDNDGDLDLYVSNIGPNRLYRNDGGMHFTDVAQELGVTEPAGRSFACWFFDYDNDGWLDLFVAGYDATLSEIAADMLHRADPKVPAGSGTRPRLYHNLHGRFEDVTARVGLDLVTLPMGANFCDYDGDGWLDIYLATGEPGYEVLVPNLMLRNDGGRRFTDVTVATGLGHLQKGHGVAFADIDQDGDQDLWHQLGGFYPDDGYYNALFENRGGGRLLSLELVGTKNRSAVGARVRVDLEAPGGPRSLHRAVGCVSSFGGSTLRQEIGLGDATAVTRVVVQWPGASSAGSEQVFTGLPLGGHVRLVEGRADVEVLVRPAFRFGAGKR